MTESAAAEPIEDAAFSSAPAATGDACRRHCRGERGQGMVEYALILILVAMAVIVAVQVLGQGTSGLYGNIENGVHTAVGG